MEAVKNKEETSVFQIKSFSDPCGNTHLEMAVTNPALGLTMSIAPLLAPHTENGKPKWWINSCAEICFLDKKGNLSQQHGSYVITNCDIPELDMTDKDMIIEIFEKYARKFERLTTCPDPSKLAQLIFMDIEEFRKARNS